MATVPTFAATPRVSSVSISTANTGRDGVAGTYGTVFAAGNNGSRIDWIHANAINAVSAGNIRYYMSGNGSQSLVADILVTSGTPGPGTGSWANDYYPSSPFLLQSGFNLRASTNNAENFVITAFGGDF